MLRFLIISVLILNISAKLLYFSKAFDEENVVDPNSSNPVLVSVGFVNTGDPLWVLSLSGDDWLAPKLRLGNTVEVEDFFTYVAPLIKNARRRRPRMRVKKDDPEKSAINVTESTEAPSPRSNNDIKNDFIKIINKLALSTSVEPDSYITEDNNTYEQDGSPSVALYFKGPYTSMVVTLGIRQWHYFMNKPTVPTWFYEDHDTRESPIIVPEEIKIKLFSSLMRYIHALFGFPV